MLVQTMKNSGIEWVGTIPNHWRLHPIYFYFNERKALNSSGEEKNLLSLSYGRVIKKDINTRKGLLPSSFNTYNIIQKGDIVFRLTDLQNDKRSLRTGLSYENGIITSAYVTIYPKYDFDTRFYHYLFHAYDINKVFYNLGNGVRQGSNYSELSRLMVIEPPKNEQIAIANFLDSKCAEIDDLCADIEKQIETLQEYKTSVITEAVTKGLDPNVEMKDSGVDWIGDIPQNWSVTRLKFTGSVRNGLTYSPSDLVDNGTPVLRSNNVQNGRLDLSDTVYVTKGKAIGAMLKNGDLLICSRNGSAKLIGKNAYIEKDETFAFGAFMMAFSSSLGKYGYYLLNSQLFPYYKPLFTTTTINQLTAKQFGEIKIPMPTAPEQKLISSFLDAKCIDIDKSLQEKKEQLDTLSLYKQALIYEYVTGKKTVPNA